MVDFSMVLSVKSNENRDSRSKRVPIKVKATLKGNMLEFTPIIHSSNMKDIQVVPKNMLDMKNSVLLSSSTQSPVFYIIYQCDPTNKDPDISNNVTNNSFPNDFSSKINKVAEENEEIEKQVEDKVNEIINSNTTKHISNADDTHLKTVCNSLYPENNLEISEIENQMEVSNFINKEDISELNIHDNSDKLIKNSTKDNNDTLVNDFEKNSKFSICNNDSSSSEVKNIASNYNIADNENKNCDEYNKDSLKAATYRLLSLRADNVSQAEECIFNIRMHSLSEINTLEQFINYTSLLRNHQWIFIKRIKTKKMSHSSSNTFSYKHNKTSNQQEKNFSLSVGTHDISSNNDNFSGMYTKLNKNIDKQYFSEAAYSSSSNTLKEFNFNGSVYCETCEDNIKSNVDYSIFDLKNGFYKNYCIICKVCNYLIHPQCLFKRTSTCKWTNSIVNQKGFLSNENLSCTDNNNKDNDLSFHLPHQWSLYIKNISKFSNTCNTCNLKLNLSFGSSFQCMWCSFTVHKSCVHLVSNSCSTHPLVLSPLDFITSSILDNKNFIESNIPHFKPNTFPLIVVLNSKSGGGFGINTRFRHYLSTNLNPIQVFDVSKIKPNLIFDYFKNLPKFYCMICGGDGSINWILFELDKRNLSNKCIAVIFPIGTGNDLSRVLKYSVIRSSTNFLDFIVNSESTVSILEPKTQLIDRWSIFKSETIDIDIIKNYLTWKITESLNLTDQLGKVSRKFVLKNGTPLLPFDIVNKVINKSDQIIVPSKSEGDLSAQQCLQHSSSYSDNISNNRVSSNVEKNNIDDKVINTNDQDFIDFIKYLPYIGKIHEINCSSNYIGIGIDAKITMDFQNLRSKLKKPSPFMNIVNYGICGMKEFFTRQCIDLGECIKMWCDGVPINVSKLRGIVFLNIKSYMAGVNFWGKDFEMMNNTFKKQEFNDKLIEVIGVFGVEQLGFSRILGAFKNYRIAQSREVVIQIFNKSIPIEIDGEAISHDPNCTLFISHKNQMKFFVRNDK